MNTLRIYLLGNIRVTRDDKSSEINLPRIAQTLLAYLLLHRQRSHSRDVLSGIFWGDRNENNARACLRTTLWRVRRALEPHESTLGKYLITPHMGNIAFNCESDFWLDVESFEAPINRILEDPLHAMGFKDAQDLEDALQLYTGELLEGFYDDWVLGERERIRSIYISTLVYLMHHYQNLGACEKGLEYGQKILALEPLREDIHRDMIRLYVESGQRSLAVQQYQTCSEILATELGITPMMDTQALYSQIVSSANDLQAETYLAEYPSKIQNTLQKLRVALLSLDGIREQVHQAIHVVEDLTEDKKHSQ